MLSIEKQTNDKISVRALHAVMHAFKEGLGAGDNPLRPALPGRWLFLTTHLSRKRDIFAFKSARVITAVAPYVGEPQLSYLEETVHTAVSVTSIVGHSRDNFAPLRRDYPGEDNGEKILEAVPIRKVLRWRV